MRSGDILFARRNAYLKRVAVAPHDGLFSAHGLVIRPKPGAIIPDFLPYFMQSDLFMERAIGISVGSLSPTVNWKDLAKQEFLLPPIQEQARLVEAASSCRAAVDALQDATDAAALAALAFGKSIAETLSDQWPLVPIGDVSEVQYGLTVNQRRAESSLCKPYLRVANVQLGWFDLSEIKEIGVFDGDEVHALQSGDVLVVEGHATRAEIGRAAIWREEIPGALHQNHLIRIRTFGGINPRYICEMINSPHGQTYFQTRAKSSSGLNTINSSVVREYQIPQPPIAVQDQVVSIFEAMSAEREKLLYRLSSAHSLMKEFLALIAGHSV